MMALPLLAVAALAAGCGGSAKASSGSTTTAPATGAQGAAAARAKFTSCLEAHGVPASEASRGFGARRGPGSSTSSSTATPPTTSVAFAAAFRACRSDLPARFGNGGLQNTAAGRAYLQCLELHGVTIPSVPPTSAGGSSAGTAPTPGGAFRSLTSNPAYQAARTACAALAPSRGAGPNGVPSTSSSTAAG